MIEPPNEDDLRRAAARYLHFEDEDPTKPPVYFDDFDQAIDYVNAHDWSFVTEDWRIWGLFEKRIECVDRHGSVVGQLLTLTVKIE